ncbi:MAG: Ig-like domain-containing protein, partial [Terriglobales bacterium]
WSSNTGCGTTTVTSGNPGTATCTTSTLGSGTDTITAIYSGDSNHSGSTGTLSQTVNQASTTTAVASSLNPSTTGQAVSFTANVTSTAGTPAGTVQFSIDGTAFGSPVTLASGSATSGTTSALSTGTHTITAAYSGATNYAASTGTLSGGQVVNPVQSQTITFNPNPPSSAAYNTSFTVAATASSGLPVAFTSTGSCTNVGATYTMNSGSGTCFVIANQAGNAQYSPAPQVTAPVTAVPASQVIACPVSAPPTATYKSGFTLSCSAPGGPVTYASAGSCTNSGATYTINKSSGTCTETITQAGNSNYAAAPPVVQHTTVAAAIAPTVSLTAPATAVYGSTYTVVATTNASTTPTITAAPATVCTISGTTVTMVNGTGTCTVTAKWAADDVYKAATATAKTIAQKMATVLTWPTPAPITYGTPLSSTQLDASASYNSSPLPGTYVYSPAAGTVPKVGTCDTLKVTFTPTQSTDFTKVTASVCLQVNAAK